MVFVLLLLGRFYVGWQLVFVVWQSTPHSPTYFYHMDRLVLALLVVWKVLSITHHFVSCHDCDSSLALLKVDMKNTLNECDRSAFLFVFQRMLWSHEVLG